jgi:hypothetical protein
VSQDWIICEWPDGTWCNLEELESYLQFMGDDYQKRRVLSWDGAYEPIVTAPL